MPLSAEAVSSTEQVLSQNDQRFQTTLGKKAVRLSGALWELDTDSAVRENQCVAQSGRTQRTTSHERLHYDGRMPGEAANASDGQVRYRQSEVGKARWDYGVTRARIRSAHRGAITACKRLLAGEQGQCKRAVALRTAQDKAEAEAVFFSATEQAKAMDGR